MLRNLPSILTLALFLSLVVTTTASTSLCISCAATFSGYCVTCNTGGCAPYSTLDTNTGNFHIIKVNATAAACTILRKQQQANHTVINVRQVV